MYEDNRVGFQKTNEIAIKRKQLLLYNAPLYSSLGVVIATPPKVLNDTIAYTSTVPPLDQLLML